SMLLREIISEKLFATPANTEFDIRNTLFFKILRANPLLTGFYADLFRRHGANPGLFRDLEASSEKNFAPDRSTNNPNQKGPNSMAAKSTPSACTHIKVNGIRCDSPALRNEVFCYFHQRMIRGVRTPPKSRLHPIAMLENQESIQAALMEIVNALVRNQIDVARARLVLRALSIAARHAGKARFDCWQSDMVKEVPEYPAAPPAAAPFAVATVQAAVATTVSSPPEGEHETVRFSRPPQPAPENIRRKPPASVKSAPRPRSATSSRGGRSG
ncbi:MAG: hypothetical protein WBG40_23055, partial [Candidatus Sulfotelmatobacter sp.]